MLYCSANASWFFVIPLKVWLLSDSAFQFLQKLVMNSFTLFWGKKKCFIILFGNFFFFQNLIFSFFLLLMFLILLLLLIVQQQLSTHIYKKSKTPKSLIQSRSCLDDMYAINKKNKLIERKCTAYFRE